MINSEEKKSPDLDQIKDDQIEKNLENLDYPANEDIYNQEEKLEDIDPEGISGERTVIQNDNNDNEWKQNSDKLGNDLDIPGSELDDEQEEIGSEDEENNFYSEGDTE
ncbi:MULTISPECIES: hypothetical protein [unclassified Flavobacterium]|jgi:hypothetical protein|uniref:hypothetical protein n=1 Tax=unclassified Flavobacterium TaxID=196869 RepID=UPI0012A91A52|nr:MULTISPECIES: hypothetical protein [unclassified Flavobacterium]MBF4488150.1 hypothetical protein [Flavobacterium sp. CSZ]QGK77128.1 hypothetical protein GIY83_24610 [Flavobacterium sp. SLB02]